jgi:hypothetical protein
LRKGYGGLKSERVNGNEKIASQNTIKVVKSRRIIWVGYVAHMRDKRNS